VKKLKYIDLIIEHKEWIFSGIGVAILGLIWRLLFKRRNKKSHSANVEIGNSPFNPVNNGSGKQEFKFDGPANFGSGSMTINNHTQDDSKKKIEKVITSSSPEKRTRFIGREQELIDIEEKLNSSNLVLLVNGMGGIGKTEICRKYYEANFDKYEHIGWINYHQSLKNSFVTQLKGIPFDENKDYDAQYEDIKYGLNNLDANSLLIIDNIENNIEDKELVDLTQFPFKVLASSREKIDEFKIYQLGFMNEQKCVDLFYAHYDGKKDDAYVIKTVKLAGYHTLTVELLAKTAKSADFEIRALYEMLRDKGFNLNEVIKEQVTFVWHGEKDRKKFFEHILKVFNLIHLSEKENYILTNLSILPPEWIQKYKLKEWLKLDSKEEINLLVEKGWVNQEESKVQMHKIIAETIKCKNKPNFHKCKNLVSSIIKSIYFNFFTLLSLV